MAKGGISGGVATAAPSIGRASSAGGPKFSIGAERSASISSSFSSRSLAAFNNPVSERSANVNKMQVRSSINTERSLRLSKSVFSQPVFKPGLPRSLGAYASAEAFLPKRNVDVPSRGKPMIGRYLPDYSQNFADRGKKNETGARARIGVLLDQPNYTGKTEASVVIPRGGDNTVRIVDNPPKSFRRFAPEVVSTAATERRGAIQKELSDIDLRSKSPARVVADKGPSETRVRTATVPLDKRSDVLVRQPVVIPSEAVSAPLPKRGIQQAGTWSLEQRRLNDKRRIVAKKNITGTTSVEATAVSDKTIIGTDVAEAEPYAAPVIEVRESGEIDFEDKKKKREKRLALLQRIKTNIFKLNVAPTNAKLIEMTNSKIAGQLLQQQEIIHPDRMQAAVLVSRKILVEQQQMHNTSQIAHTRVAILQEQSSTQQGNRERNLNAAGGVVEITVFDLNNNQTERENPEYSVDESAQGARIVAISQAAENAKDATGFVEGKAIAVGLGNQNDTIISGLLKLFGGKVDGSYEAVKNHIASLGILLKKGMATIAKAITEEFPAVKLGKGKRVGEKEVLLVVKGPKADLSKAA